MKQKISDEDMMQRSDLVPTRVIKYGNIVNAFFRRKNDPLGRVFYASRRTNREGPLTARVRKDGILASVRHGSDLPNPWEDIEIINADDLDIQTVEKDGNRYIKTENHKE